MSCLNLSIFIVFHFTFMDWYSVACKTLHLYLTCLCKSLQLMLTLFILITSCDELHLHAAVLPRVVDKSTDFLILDKTHSPFEKICDIHFF